MIGSLFTVPLLRLTCSDFKNKRKKIKRVLEAYPERRNSNFYSNRGLTHKNLIEEFTEIFKNEFSFITKAFNKSIKVNDVWSVTYGKGDYHVPHNHGSTGYAGIVYLELPNSAPKTIYIQPWNDSKDNTVLEEIDVSQGNIVIVPKFVMHFTRPSPSKLLKRIVSFDFETQ